MAPQGPRLALALLLCLAAACLPLSTADAQHAAFLKRHLDFPKSGAENDGLYCTATMRQRSLRCRGRNTFLHTSEARLRAVCGGEPSHGTVTRESLAAFPLTVCTCLPKGPCLYRGISTTARVRLVCRDGRPVRYERRI
ncbi:ribonuclease-like [Emydura macquarii macquarii]|uniref:ribonuclease-like n=1 Tax=Emydura macquarii macquarii TaxID=1129001 RepID=UPI00352A3AEE